MKKIYLALFALQLVLSTYSQGINSQYFPKDNIIDTQYLCDMQKWITNSEWQEIIVKYRRIWESQMYLEMDRLINLIPDQVEDIKLYQKDWEKNLYNTEELVQINVDQNKVGREPYFDWLSSITELYRQRSIYYFCLYYTIKEQSDDSFKYHDNLELAR